MTVLNTSNWWLSHTAGAPDADWLAHVRAILGVGGDPGMVAFASRNDAREY